MTSTQPAKLTSPSSEARIVIKSASKGDRFHGASDLVLDLQSVVINGQPYTIDTAEVTEKGKSGVGPITRFDSSQFPTKIAAEVKSFNPSQFMDRKDIKKMDTFMHYAIAAAEFAKVSMSLPGDFLARVAQVVAAMAGVRGRFERIPQYARPPGCRRLRPHRQRPGASFDDGPRIQAAASHPRYRGRRQSG
jgi:3-oxoacyl-(acyl-carrier-protein) synthase